MMRAIMDRFPGIGPAMNRVTGSSKTMLRVAEYRELQARLAEAERGVPAAAVCNDITARRM